MKQTNIMRKALTVGTLCLAMLQMNTSSLKAQSSTELKATDSLVCSEQTEQLGKEHGRQAEPTDTLATAAEPEVAKDAQKLAEEQNPGSDANGSDELNQFRHRPVRSYAVPLKTPYRISGSFGELRSNHYHAGLDMGTAGVENIEVHSAEAGWVSRVKVGPWGYGRALYIDHPDGHTTVYGHLNGFATRIDSVVRAAQYAKEDFSVEVYLEPIQIAVQRDEVVAYSGNTGGSGGPHLHFEVRDTKTEEPLNPQLFIETVADNVPPTIVGIKVYSTNDTTLVNGQLRDRYYTRQQIKGQTIQAYGQVGFGIECFDNVERGGRPVGVVEVVLYDNGKVIFHSRVDHFPFSLNRHVNNHIDMAERQQTKRYVERSFVSPGNQLPVYLTCQTPTLIAEGQRHDITYEALDLAGNISKLSFTVVGRKPHTLVRKQRAQGTLVRWQQPCVMDTLGMRVEMEPKTLFEDGIIDFGRSTNSWGSDVYSVGQSSITTQKSFSITLPIPQEWQDEGKLQKVFVGRMEGNRLIYLGGKVEQRWDRKEEGAGAYCIKAQSLLFGKFGVGIDTIAPSLSIRNKSQALRRQHQIILGIGDNMSGIAKYDVWIDGKWEVFEYDYKNARLKASIEYLGIGRGQHTLKAQVTDCCGNSKSIEWRFSVVN